MKIITPLFLLFLLHSISFSQNNQVDVAELTLKIGGSKTKEIYYGFAEGDIIVFDFEEINGKPLKEIEIVELPNNSKFMDFKSTSVVNKNIKVNKTGVYKFSFKNSTLKGRICKVNIKRIPKTEELANFNTEWEWKTSYDTTYIPHTADSLIGYDTSFVTKTRKELLKIDTIISELFNKEEVVHSALNSSSSYSYLTVNLPTNTYKPNVFKVYESTEVIAWSYWLGTGKESIQQYEKANKLIKKGVVAFGTLAGYGALTSLAVTGVSMFIPPNTGDNVHYEMFYNKNDQKYTFDAGNVISASARNTRLKQGTFYIELYNDNVMDRLTVLVKVIAVQVRKTWHDVEYQELITTPKYVTLNKQKMTVETRKIRVNVK